jgi:cytochrome c oxidase subunit IV
MNMTSVSERLNPEALEANRKVGRWSALAVFYLGLLYVVCGAVGTFFGGSFWPPLQIDPFLAILEALIILAAPIMVVMMAAVHSCGPQDKKAFSLTALSLMILLAGTTCGVHFIQLVVLRRFEPAALAALSPIASHPWKWPSMVFALDLLAWDLFLGLSMLFAARVFDGGGLQKHVRMTMNLSGTLCMAGLLGPVSGEMRLQGLAIVGYAFVFPIVCLLLATMLGRTATSST